LILDIQLVPRLPKQNPTCVAIIDPQDSGELAWLGGEDFTLLFAITQGCVNQRVCFLFIKQSLTYNTSNAN